MPDRPHPPADTETRQAIRALAEMVAILAQRCWAQLGTDVARGMVERAVRIQERFGDE